MAFWKVLEAESVNEAEKSLQAYRWDPFSQPIMYKPDQSGSMNERIVAAEERSNPTNFKVEFRAQFVESMNAYFDATAVTDIFKPFWDDRQLAKQTVGKVKNEYKIHCDPALVNDMFSVMVAHAEQAPEKDEFGIQYKHLVIDWYTVYKPQDFPDGKISYEFVLAEIKNLMLAFMPSSVTCDQFNSAYLTQTLAAFARKHSLHCNVYEETATGEKNFKMFENLKFSINNRLVHSYYDELNKKENWRCLLQAMLEQVQLKKGKIEKPRSEDFGHLDLVDCCAVLAMQLLGDQSESLSSLMTNSAFVDNSSILQSRFQSAKLSDFTGMNSPMSGFRQR